VEFQKLLPKSMQDRRKRFQLFLLGTFMTKMMVSRGAEHPHSVLSVENLGRLLQKQGNWSEAESYFRQALQLREKTLGPTHPDTLLAANNLALDPWNFADQSSLFLFLVFLWPQAV